MTVEIENMLAAQTAVGAAMMAITTLGLAPD